MLTRIRSPHVLVLLSFALLTVIFTYPLILNFSSHVLSLYGRRLDNMEYVWKLWWTATAVQQGISPFFNPNVYVPFGYPMAYGEITPIHTFGLLPITLTFGEIVAYNVAAVGSTILSGFAMYLLAWRWIPADVPVRVRGLAAWFAGAAFAVCAYRLQKLTGHLPLFDTHWLVLALLMFDRWLETRRSSDLIWTALWTSFAALSSWYYAFMLALLLPIYALARGDLISLLRDRRIYPGIGAALLVGIALCLPFALPYTGIDSSAAYVPLSDATFWAVSITDYLMPNPLHPLWGSAVQRLMWPFPGEMVTEFVISVGWITLVLMIAGWRQTGGSRWRALKVMMLAALVLSFGPILQLSRLPLGIPLPAYLLRELLPFAAGIRTWGRFSIMVMIGACALAAVGLAQVLRSLEKRRQAIVFGGLAAAMLFGAWIGPFPLAEVAPRPVDVWLAAQSDRSPVMEYPLNVALSGSAILATRYHGKPVVFGYGTYLPLVYRERHPALLTFPADAALDQLAEWDVRYILVTVSELAGEPYTIAEIEAQPRLEYVTTEGDVRVYQLLRPADQSPAAGSATGADAVSSSGVAVSLTSTRLNASIATSIIDRSGVRVVRC